MTATTLDPNDPLYTIVTINGVELTSSEVLALRAAIEIGHFLDAIKRLPNPQVPHYVLRRLDAASNEGGMAASLRRIQSLLAN
jgi:hypothetical protein